MFLAGTCYIDTICQRMYEYIERITTYEHIFTDHGRSDFMWDLSCYGEEDS